MRLTRGILVAVLVAACGGSSGPTVAPTGTQLPTSPPSPEATPTPTLAPVPTLRPTPVPTPFPIPSSYDVLTDRNWAKLVKDPDVYKDKGYKVWACVTQFDAATGSDTFRGQASNALRHYWYADGTNAYFVGLEPELADVVKDDVIAMDVLAGGSFTYDTTIGGSETVPLFAVVTVKVVGSCA